MTQEEMPREFKRNINEIISRVQNIPLVEWAAQSGNFVSKCEGVEVVIALEKDTGLYALLVDGLWICENESRLREIVESVDSYLKEQDTLKWREKVSALAKKMTK